MIQTIKEYKASQKITWRQLANRFGANHHQEALQWADYGWLVVTEIETERLVAVRRERVKTN